MRNKLIFGSALVIIFSVLAILLAAPTQALTGNQFQAGNIIDDGVFFNRSSMSVQQIQNFLNSKVPNCDTWGTQRHSSGQTRAQYGASKGYSAPYTCLKDYVVDTPSKSAENQLCGAYGGGRKSSAQIIYDVSQVCGINPQILLVLLQKEQSLITDDWPWSNQYRSATGFGCPDTAPCDSEYYGFFNQVYHGARIYKKYARDANLYNYRAGRNNNIRYNPNAACGSSSIYLHNQATAGLYVYTPYQPNQAALNNLYGTGDGCSAYGNRNFWRMFNDWFGSTLGSLIRTYSSGALYYYDGERRFYISSSGQTEQYGLGGFVRYISDAEMSSIPIASAPFSSELGYIIKASDSDTLYLVNNGTRIPISSMEVFNELGFTSGMIKVLPRLAVERLSLSGSYLSKFVQAPDMSIYKIESQKRRAIFELSKMTQEIGSNPVMPLSSFNLSLWTYGTPLVDGDYVAIGPDGAVRLYNQGTYNAVSSMSNYNCWNLNSYRIFRLPSLSITNGSNRGTLTCFTKHSNNDVFLMDGSKKYKLNNDQNITVSNTTDSAISRLPTSSLTQVLKHPNGELSVYEQNMLRPIPSMDDFSALGYTTSSITATTKDSYESFKKGAKALAPGSTLVSGNGSVYITSSHNSSIYIGTMDIFNDFKFKWPSLAPSNTNDLSAFPNTGSLSSIVKTESGVFIVDGGASYKIDPQLDSHYNINRSSINMLNGRLLRYTNTSNLSRFIMSNNSSNVYYVENGQRRLIESWDKYLELSNGQNGSIIKLSNKNFARLSEGSPI